MKYIEHLYDLAVSRHGDITPTVNAGKASDLFDVEVINGLFYFWYNDQMNSTHVVTTPYEDSFYPVRFRTRGVDIDEDHVTYLCESCLSETKHESFWVTYSEREQEDCIEWSISLRQYIILMTADVANCPHCKMYAEHSLIGRGMLLHGLDAYSYVSDLDEKADKTIGNQICGSIVPVGTIGLVVSGDIHVYSKVDLHSRYDESGKRYFWKDKYRPGPLGSKPDYGSGEGIITPSAIEAVWFTTEEQRANAFRLANRLGVQVVKLKEKTCLSELVKYEDFDQFVETFRIGGVI